MNAENSNEVDALLIEWEEGTLDDHDMDRLRAMLRTDESLRNQFVQMQMLQAALTLERDAGFEIPTIDEAVQDLDPSTTTTDKSQTAWQMRRFGSRALSRSLAAVAALLMCAIVGRWVFLESQDRSSQNGRVRVGHPVRRSAEQEATSQGIAMVTRLVDVVWKGEQSPLDIGDALSPGRLAVESGYAQIEFFCGATVIIEGPAELELRSASLARVHSGRLRAQVPPAARGFSLEIDEMKVVDLGTEFALSVSAEGANVQVFDGEVELHRPSNQKRLLTAGQAVVRTVEGLYQEAPVTPEKFVDIAGLASRAQMQRTARYDRWKASSDEVRRDPRLIAYYSFDQAGDWERRLACSNEPPDRELDGAIVGARELEGRWESKRALEFKQPADRVRIQVPGEYSSLTLACWVKIDSLDRWYNSLFLTDGYDKGEPHWQILDSGQLYFSVRPGEQGEQGPHDFKALSPSFWEPSLNGKWIHLAVTCDVGTKTITHYMNGNVLSHHVVPDNRMPSSTRIGTASIGNWSLPTRPDARFAIRNLNGSIDEFAMFSAALTADEIKEMYENGRP